MKIISPKKILNGIPTINTFICGIIFAINARSKFPKKILIIIGIAIVIALTNI